MVCSVENRGSITLVHGANLIEIPDDGLSAAELRCSYRDVLNVGPEARPYVAGNLVEEDFVPVASARVVFERDWGRKGSGEPGPRSNTSGGIDISTERVLFFKQVADRLPRGKSGMPIHANTIWRWATKGLKGPNGEVVRLECGKIGGRNCTTEEALQRFFDRLKGKIVETPIPSAQAKRSKRAEEELKKLGF